MYNREKLHSNLWIKIPHGNFDKLLQIQKDLQLKSVEDVVELLLNTHNIDCLAEESKEYVKKMTFLVQST